MRTVNPIQHEASRNRILSSARRLFAAQGVKETSMAQVAKACRVTKATLYHYFKSKDDILGGIFLVSLADQERFVASVEFKGSLEETLATIARTYLDMIGRKEATEIMKIFQAEGMKSSEVCRRYNESVKERMGRYLRIGVERGILPDIDRSILHNVVFTFFGSLEHHFMHAHVLKCEFACGGDEGYIHFLSRMFSRTLEAVAKLAEEGKIPKGEVTTP